MTYIETASRNMYDPSSLGDLKQVMHKFDCDIKSNKDAFEKTNEALKASGDNYNYAMTTEEVKAMNDSVKGKFGGVGNQIRSVDLDEQGKIIPPPPDSAKDTTAPAKPDAQTAGVPADKTAPAPAPHHGTLVDEVLGRETPAEARKTKFKTVI